MGFNNLRVLVGNIVAEAAAVVIEISNGRFEVQHLMAKGSPISRQGAQYASGDVASSCLDAM